MFATIGGIWTLYVLNDGEDLRCSFFCCASTVTSGAVGREGVRMAFPHLFHVLLMSWKLFLNG